MLKRSMKPSRPVYPSPAGLITSISPEGKPNIITLGEVFNISIFDPVIIGIAIGKPRYSHALISATREFVVNLPTSSMAKVIDQCGTVSGRTVDKFSQFGLTAAPAEKVRPPLIAECPVNIECRVLSIQEVGDHDLFLGEAVAQHVAEDVLDASGRIRVERLDPLCFVHWEYWSFGTKVGQLGFSR